MDNKTYNHKSQMRLHENKVFIWNINKKIFELCDSIMHNYNNYNISTDKHFTIYGDHFVFKYNIEYKYFVKIVSTKHTTERDINYHNDCQGVKSKIILMRTNSRRNKKSYYLAFSNNSNFSESETNISKKINTDYKSFHSYRKCSDLTKEEVEIVINTLSYLKKIVN